MKNMFIVMNYTIKENIRKKTFKVTNAIILSLIVILFNIPNIINAFSNNNDGNNTDTEEKILVVDKSNIFKNKLEDLTIPNSYIFDTDNETSMEDLKKDLEESKFKAILVINENENIVSTDYIFRKEDKYYDVTALNNILKSIYTNVLLDESNVSEDIITKINTPFNFTVTGLGAGEEETGLAFTLSMVFSIFLYFTIYFYGYSVSSSISSEKTSRVMETLITSTKPSSIVLGKTLGMGILGLLQILMVFIVSYISYNVFLPKDYMIFGEFIDLSMFTLPLILLIILYFILGYAIYAMMSAVTGATVSKAEDLSAASMPISMISLLSFYLGYFSLLDSSSSINIFASIFPLSSAFTMPSRIITGNALGWEVALSIFLLVLTITVLGWISIRVYSAALLHYGQRLTLKDLFKMYKND